MPSCCYGDEYGSMFDPKGASRNAAEFRRRGLRGSAQELVNALAPLVAPGGRLLEVGGGVGQIQVALLEAGVVAEAVNVELAASWEDAARAMLAERGLSDRVQRIVGDFVDLAPGLPAADVVVLHRVVCCYPHWRTMLDAAHAKAKHVVALTVPSDRWWTRAGVRVTNVGLRWRGLSFRAFVHPPEAMIDLLASVGLAVVHDTAGLVWRTVVMVRTREFFGRSASSVRISSGVPTG